jgi:hypothetical protein
LKRLYGDKHLQSGVVVFVMLYRDILRHFSKAEKLACGSLLDELSKTMAPDHRAACESSSRTSGLSSGLEIDSCFLSTCSKGEKSRSIWWLVGSVVSLSESPKGFCANVCKVKNKKLRFFVADVS